MPSVKEPRVNYDQLKTANTSLKEENTSLKEENASLKVANDAFEILLQQVQVNYKDDAANLSNKVTALNGQVSDLETTNRRLKVLLMVSLAAGATLAAMKNQGAFNATVASVRALFNR